MSDAPFTPIEVGLTAAIVAVEAEEPRILVAADPQSQIRAGLPFGPFDPVAHRAFEIGLRAKRKYRPAVFELLPDEFTLTELQRAVEAISGRHLHKQNFRRLVESAGLVEPTGETSNAAGGRPAALFRFRRNVVQERPAPGLRLGGRA